MMQLTCPLCGPRAENEFHCGGTTAIARPPLDCSDETWGTVTHEVAAVYGITELCPKVPS